MMESHDFTEMSQEPLEFVPTDCIVEQHVDLFSKSRAGAAAFDFSRPLQLDTAAQVRRGILVLLACSLSFCFYLHAHLYSCVLAQRDAVRDAVLDAARVHARFVAACLQTCLEYKVAVHTMRDGRQKSVAEQEVTQSLWSTWNETFDDLHPRVVQWCEREAVEVDNVMLEIESITASTVLSDSTTAYDIQRSCAKSMSWSSTAKAIATNLAKLRAFTCAVSTNAKLRNFACCKTFSRV